MYARVSVARVLAIGLGLAALLTITPAVLAQDPSGPGPANRALLRFSDGAFELVSVTPLDTVLAPSDELPAELGAVSGFWFELQDGDSLLRYRRVIDNPVLLVFEGPEPDVQPQLAAPRSPAQRVKREGSRNLSPRRPEIESSTRASLERDHLEFNPVAVERGRAANTESPIADPSRDEAVPAERLFTLLMPAAVAGDQLVLFGSPLVEGAQAEASVELARFVLRLAPEGGE